MKDKSYLPFFSPMKIIINLYLMQKFYITKSVINLIAFFISFTEFYRFQLM